MDVTAKMATGSTEFLHVPLISRRYGIPVAPTDVRMAILPGTDGPATEDWHDAEYVDGQVRLLIGPIGGTLTLTPGDYYVWVRLTAGDETPIKQAPGSLHIY